MIIQLLSNGIVSGCLYSLIGLGFALIYNTTRTFHIAHGAVFVGSAYVFFALYVIFNLPLIPALLITLIGSALFGLLIDILLYQPLVKKQSSQLIQMLSSLGLYIVIVNFIAMFFGNVTKVAIPGIQSTKIVGSVILTHSQIATIIVFFIVLFLIMLALYFTKLGQNIRAMRDDPDLVSTMGINPGSIRRCVFSLGSVLAGIAAILMSLDVGIDPNIGMPALITGAVAVLIGGIGEFKGAVCGGFLIGILQSVVVWRLSARWQEMVTFILLLTFLIFRPQGIFGVKYRAEELRS